jgi:hypothetical protein
MNRTLFLVIVLLIGYILGVKFPQLANAVGL